MILALGLKLEPNLIAWASALEHAALMIRETLTGDQTQILDELRIINKQRAAKRMAAVKRSSNDRVNGPAVELSGSLPSREEGAKIANAILSIPRDKWEV